MAQRTRNALHTARSFDFDDAAIYTGLESQMQEMSERAGMVEHARAPDQKSQKKFNPFNFTFSGNKRQKTTGFSYEKMPAQATPLSVAVHRAPAQYAPQPELRPTTKQEGFLGVDARKIKTPKSQRYRFDGKDGSYAMMSNVQEDQPVENGSLQAQYHHSPTSESKTSFASPFGTAFKQMKEAGANFMLKRKRDNDTISNDESAAGPVASARSRAGRGRSNAFSSQSPDQYAISPPSAQMTEQYPDPTRLPAQSSMPAMSMSAWEANKQQALQQMQLHQQNQWLQSMQAQLWQQQQTLLSYQPGDLPLGYRQRSNSESVQSSASPAPRTTNGPAWQRAYLRTSTGYGSVRPRAQSQGLSSASYVPGLEDGQQQLLDPQAAAYAYAFNGSFRQDGSLSSIAEAAESQQSSQGDPEISRMLLEGSTATEAGQFSTSNGNPAMHDGASSSDSGLPMLKQDRQDSANDHSMTEYTTEEPVSPAQSHAGSSRRASLVSDMDTAMDGPIFEYEDPDPRTPRTPRIPPFSLDLLTQPVSFAWMREEEQEHQTYVTADMSDRPS